VQKSHTQQIDVDSPSGAPTDATTKNHHIFFDYGIWQSALQICRSAEIHRAGLIDRFPAREMGRFRSPKIDTSPAERVHLQLPQSSLAQESRYPRNLDERPTMVQRSDDEATPIGAHRAIVVLALSLALAACAGSPFGLPSTSATADSTQNSPTSESPPPVVNPGQRELTPAEKKIIVNALSPSLRDPGSAKFRWAKIRNATDGAVNYCGTVNAKSPYPAYNGQQAYILEATMSGGKVSAAVVGLIAGGKDIEIVRSMCKKYDLDPSDAT
jgi:hypothetical protein